MKLAALVVVLSAIPLSTSRAEDVSAKSQGSCMPIGLTASGEVVFPWECRAIIEKERGPVSSNVPSAASDPSAKADPPKDQAKDQGAEQAAPPEQATSTAAVPSQPQVATVDRSPSSKEAVTAPVRAAPPLHAKHPLAAPAEKKRQIAAQPAATAAPPASSPTSSIRALFSR